MAKPRKLWRLSATEPELTKRLAKQLKISGVIAQILINRGLRDERMASEFLFGDISSLHDPYLLKDMEKAVQRIRRAIEAKEKITVYGDYDVDGITATALLVRVLKKLGASVDYYIPDRQNEGYGLNLGALDTLYKEGTVLLITVDSGISAINEVMAFKNKIDIVITDHHQPSAVLPEACAVINPKRPECTYPDKNLAGVGVAFKLCQALWSMLRTDESHIFEYLDFVAIGSIADIVPLLGENRILVKHGLEQLASTTNQGLNALLKSCKLEAIDAGKVGFIIAPRLNAAGRIGLGTVGVELLLTEDNDYAGELAVYLEQQNMQRQALEKEILAAAESLLTEYDFQNNKVIVLSGTGWHSGVIGIVASRLVDKYYRPVIIISENNGIGKGSCRSIPGFDLYDALSQCSDILLKFGGHRLAAGLSVNIDNISELRRRLNDIAQNTLKDDDYIPVLNVDAQISLQEISSALLEELACLAPHGMGNPRPIFTSVNLVPESIKTLGREEQHLRLTVRQQLNRQNVISWGMGHMFEQFSKRPNIDIAFAPEFNDWQGHRSIQLCAQDIKLTSVSQNGNNRNIQNERAVVGQVYLALKALNTKPEINCTSGQLVSWILSTYGTELTNTGIDLAIEVLNELGLITKEECQASYKISLRPTPAMKLNIENSNTFNHGGLAKHIKVIGYKNWRA